MVTYLYQVQFTTKLQVHKRASALQSQPWSRPLSPNVGLVAILVSRHAIVPAATCRPSFKILCTRPRRSRIPSPTAQPHGLSCHRPTVSQVTSPRANPSSASWQEAVNKSTHTFEAVRLSHRVVTSSACLTRVPLVLASGRCRCTGGSAGAHAGGAVQPGTGAREEERPGGDHGGGLEGG